MAKNDMVVFGIISQFGDLKKLKTALAMIEDKLYKRVLYIGEILISAKKYTRGSQEHIAPLHPVHQLRMQLYISET